MASSFELFDIYNERMERIGTAPRHEVHAKGYWHRTFQCWIVRRWENRTYLLFQHRHPNKDIFPDLLDISCAGHLQAGEEVEEAIRELEEELGVSVDFRDLRPCGIAAEEDWIREDLIDREFSHVFILEYNQPLTAYRLQEDEVVGLVQIELKDAIDLIGGKVESVLATGVCPDRSTGGLQEFERVVTRQDLTPHSQEYYKMLFDHMK